MRTINKQLGSVSIFVVIFAALLITVVTVSFVRIMIQSQQQASTVDLSQSAYDSAQAGIEDAKRALLRYQSICNSGGDCPGASNAINSTECNVAVGTLTDVDSSNNEVKVKTGNGDLNQAYTCVTIRLNTVDYLGKLATNESKIIPLRGENAFTTVQIEWFSPKDLSSNDNGIVDLQSLGTPLLAESEWSSNKPPIMRAQLIQFGGNFSLNDFNDNKDNSESNTNTLFLYPSTVGIEAINFSLKDVRRDSIGTPIQTKCSDDISDGAYSCVSQLTLPTPIGGGVDRTAYLRLTALYNGANYRIKLFNGSDPILFNGVQPSIDSTGRANNLFRRVQARVEFDANFPYPDAEINVSGNFCKDFLVTNDPSNYSSKCEP